MQGELINIIVLCFLLILLSLTLLLVLHRLIMGPYLRWRLDKIKEWGEMLDHIIARLDEPRPQEIERLKTDGRFSRHIVEEVLLERMDLMAGRSLIPLIKIFQESGLLNVCLSEMDDNNVWKRRMAANKLSRGAGRRSAGYLMRAFDDPDPDVRVIAARGLGNMGIQVAAPHMVSQFDQLEEVKCMAIAEALIDLGSAALIPLCAGLSDESEKMRYYCALTVSRVCEDGRCQMIVMEKMPRRRITDVPFVYPKDITGVLRLLTWDDSSRVRRATIEALGSLQAREATPRVERLLATDMNPEIREASARALSLLGRDESVEILQQALSDPYWEVQLAAAGSLIELGAPRLEHLDQPGYKSKVADRWREEIEEGVAIWT